MMEPDLILGTISIAVRYTHPLVILLPHLLCLKRRKTLQLAEDGPVIHTRWLCLIFGMALSYAAETVIYLYRPLLEPEWRPSHELVLHAIALQLLWSALGMAFLHMSRSSVPQYHGYGILAGLWEVLIEGLDLTLISRSPRNGHYTAIITLQTLRIFCNGILVFFLRPQISAEHTQNDEESQTLLAEDRTTPTLYGSIPASGSTIKNLPSKQDWAGYFKQYRIILHCLLPNSTRQILNVLGVISNLALQRYFKILIPLKFGQITNELIANNSKVAYQSLAFWFLLTFLTSTDGPTNQAGMLFRLDVEQSALRRICNFGFNRVMGFDLNFHMNKATAEVAKALEQGSSVGNLVSLQLFDMLPLVIDLVIAVGLIALRFDFVLASVLIMLSIAYVSSIYSLNRWTRPYLEAGKEAERKRSTNLHESLRNHQTVVIFDRSDSEGRMYGEAVRDEIDLAKNYLRRHYLGATIQQTMLSWGVFTILSLAIQRISTSHAPVGDFLYMSSIVQSLTFPLLMVRWGSISSMRLSVASNRMVDILNTRSVVHDDKDAKELVITAGEVEFRDVSFSYNREDWVFLSDISFIATLGQTIAIVGESGVGKSTIFKLLSRAFDPTKGSILIDGQDIRTVTQKSLHRALGIVSQEPVLFNRSIRDNISYGRENATLPEIEGASKAAAIHEHIMSLPDRYDTKVGEQGISFSGGQRQRLAIARTLLKGPKILVLDEATSALDSFAEANIQNALHALQAGRTTFSVAHRLSTIMHADSIIVLGKVDGKGVIVERGTHQELVARKGTYYRFWSLQNGKDDASHQMFP